MSRSPWTLRHAHSRDISSPRARAWRSALPGKARHCLRGGRGGCVVAGCTGNGRWRAADCSLRWEEDQTTRGQTQALGPDPRARAHRPARAHGEKGARSPLCCRFTWGVWLVVVVGRQTRVWVATYVRVSTIGRYRLKYLYCLRQCSSQAHMCESYHNGTFF